MQSILIIEDELELREGVSEILRFEGYNVMEASNGEDGISLSKLYVPDLILCDILMPQKNGFEVIKEIREDPLTCIVPFVFLTALSNREKIREGMNAGADDYLEKPFSREELIKTIEARIKKSNSFKKHTDLPSGSFKTKLISHIPHELRTPINSILGFSELLMTDAHLLDKGQIGNMAKIINSNGERLYSNIKKYFLFLELELSKEKHSFHCIRIYHEVVVDIAQKVSSTYGREDDLFIKGNDCSTKAIINLFQVAVYELIDNAFKFSEVGTKVIVNVFSDEKSNIVQITDRGRGFPQAVNNIVAFQQFNRQQFEQQGLGLGLFIAKRIITMHKGELKIEDNKTKGTSISIILPKS